MGNRKRLPESTKRKLLLEAGYMCSNPRCRSILVLELHHLVHLSEGGGDDHANLLALCPTCHALHHAGHIPSDALLVWKQMLITLNAIHVGNADLLIRLYKMKESASLAKLTFSGDAMLTLAPLLNAGLVSLEGGFWDSTGRSSLRFELTERGKALVEAWLSGNTAQLESVAQETDQRI